MNNKDKNQLVVLLESAINKIDDNDIKIELGKILDKVNACQITTPKAEAKDFSKMTMVEKIRRIEKVLEEDVRPKLNMDGGSVELVDLDGTLVKVRLLGMCSGCMGAAGTIENLVEKALKEKVDPSLTVEHI